MQNYYQILGVSVSATEAEIKTAFKKLAMQFHPDRNPGSKFHEDHYKTITQAYENLIDSEKRTIYDLKLVFGMMDEPSRPNPPRQGPTTAPPPHVYRGAQTGRTQSRQGEPTSNKTQTVKDQGFSNFQKVGNVVLVVAALIMLGLWLHSLRSRYSAEQAISTGNYDIALSYDSTNAMALFVLGMQKAKQNDNTAAIDYLSKAITNSANPDVRMLYERGKLYFNDKNYPLAYPDFIAVSKIEPKFDTIWLKLGDIAMLHLKDYDKAQEFYSSGLELNSNFYECYLGKGVAYYNSGNVDAGMEALNSATYVNKLRPESYYFRAYCKLAKNNTDGACTDFKLSYDLGYKKAQAAFDSLCTQTN